MSKSILFALCAVLTTLMVTTAQAALLPMRFVATKIADNSGAGVYQIEQEVQFQTSTEPLVIRETWWIENESNFRMQAVGQKQLKDLFFLDYAYSNGQRYFLTPKGKMVVKLGDNMIEKYFHYRSPDKLLNDLVHLKVLTPSSLEKKIYRSSKEIEHRPEPQVRLARSGGSLSYALGTPSAIEGATAEAGFWIEQDTFLIKKFRLPSGVEVQAEKHSPAARGLYFPQVRTVRWNNNSLMIHTIGAQSRTGIKSTFFHNSSLEKISKTEGLDGSPVGLSVLEFYQRFR